MKHITDTIVIVVHYQLITLIVAAAR